MAHSGLFRLCVRFACMQVFVFLKTRLVMRQRDFIFSAVVASVVLAASSVGARADDFVIANGYHAQETAVFCGPASIQMMLDTPNVLGNYVNPVLPTQTALFNFAQATNLEPWYTSPAGMVADLNAVDGGFHTYNSYSTLSRNQNSRTIANALSQYGIPGSVLIRGGQHWVDINGVNTTGAIGLNQAYTINGFYGRDPWPAAGTLGQNFYLAYNNNPRSAWARLFTPVSSGNIWRGTYTSVLEPQGPESLDTGSFDSTPLAPLPLPLEENAVTADTSAIADLAADPVLSGAAGFENGSFVIGDEQHDSYSTDPSTEEDWIVPYESSPGVVTGALAIDADTGAIDYASWEDPGQSLGLSDMDALFGDIFSDNLVDDSGEANTPEPASLGILGVSSLALLARRRRR